MDSNKENLHFGVEASSSGWSDNIGAYTTYTVGPDKEGPRIKLSEEGRHRLEDILAEVYFSDVGMVNDYVDNILRLFSGGKEKVEDQLPFGDIDPKDIEGDGTNISFARYRGRGIELQWSAQRVEANFFVKEIEGNLHAIEKSVAKAILSAVGGCWTHAE